METKTIALYITPSGKKVCDKLRKEFDKSIVIKKITKNNLQKRFEEAFCYKNIIAVMATGIVVRAIAPFIKDKTKDPAIAVIDEKGRFVISLLSGHIGGANELTNDIAKKIGATPVITTSSDVEGYKALDLYAKEKNYIISDMTLYRKVAGYMTRKKRIPVFIEDGEDKNYFKNDFFEIINNIFDFEKRKCLKVAVTYKKLKSKNILYLIPKKLILGIGFHKGLSGEKLYNLIRDTLEKEKIHIQAINKIATIDKRKNEKGLHDLSKILKTDLCFFKSEDLKKVSGLEVSNVVAKYHGTGNICEASAILGSNYGKIIIPKIKKEVLTLCIAQEKSL